MKGKQMRYEVTLEVEKNGVVHVKAFATTASSFEHARQNARAVATRLKFKVLRIINWRQLSAC